MKKQIITAFVFAGLLAWGCSKDSSSHPVLTSITGTWKYIGYSGGLAGFPFTPVDTVESYIQVDTLNTRIMFSVNGEQQCSGYTFDKDASPYYTLMNLTDTITYANSFEVHLSHDTLTIYPHNFADAFTASFVPTTKHFTWCDGAAH